jgi:hypothetical protein
MFQGCSLPLLLVCPDGGYINIRLTPPLVLFDLLKIGYPVAIRDDGYPFPLENWSVLLSVSIR